MLRVLMLRVLDVSVVVRHLPRTRFIAMVMMLAAMVMGEGLFTASPAIAQEGPSSETVTIAAELNAPQGVLVDADGAVWVIDSGVGGDTEIPFPNIETGEMEPAFFGETARVIMVAPDGSQVVVATLPSLVVGEEAVGGARLALLAGELYATSGGMLGAPDDEGMPNMAAVVHIGPDGVSEVASTWVLEASQNPDGFIFESHPYGLAAGSDGRLWVAEAGANDLLAIDPESGEIEVVAVFDGIPSPLPNPARENAMESDPVPTGITFDEEGTAYVSFLPGFPFLPGSAKVVQVASDGAVSDYATGLTMITDLRTGPDGEMYAVQLGLFTEEGPVPNSGAIVRVKEGDASEVVVSGLSFPTSIDFNEAGDAYIAINGAGPPGAGEVVMIAGLTALPALETEMEAEGPVSASLLEISAEFPFESNFVDVLDSEMHYVDVGEGDPILFLHGNPTSSYLWRNIIPHVIPHGRAIAVDLIGMGKSGKPDIDYTFADHSEYLDAFIEELGLENITLVIHDWGSGLGFDYAARNPDNVKAIAFMEAVVAPGLPTTYDQMPPDLAEMFATMRDPELGPMLIIDQNMFVEQLLPSGVVRELTEEEMDAYREPYLEPESRLPVLVWPNEVPIDGEPADVVERVNAYNEWLFRSDIPKLHLYATPGTLNPPEMVDFLSTQLQNYETHFVGQGLHFIQEDNPHAIGLAISDWLRRLEESSMMGAAPLPDTAYGEAIPQDIGYLLEELGDGIYAVSDGTYQMMFLTTGEGVIVVDAPPSLGELILDAIAEVTDEPITHVIYSHAHADHIGAAGIYPADAIYIAHEAAAAHLAENGADDTESELPFGIFVGGGPVPLPTETFAEGYTLEVGDQVLELDYYGTNHSPGNIFIYAPDHGVLMLVDVIFPGWTPFKNLALAQDVPGYIDAHLIALEYDFDTFIGGHLTRLGTVEDVETQLAYVLDMQANAATALMTVDFFAIAEQTGFENQWLLFDTYLDAVADVCTELTLEDWGDQLGGADVFTQGHCFEFAESLRID